MHQRVNTGSCSGFRICKWIQQIYADLAYNLRNSLTIDKTQLSLVMKLKKEKKHSNTSFSFSMVGTIIKSDTFLFQNSFIDVLDKLKQKVANWRVT